MYCMDDNQKSNLKQQLRVTYSGETDFSFDIGLRTKAVHEESMTFYSDDSMNLNERHFYTIEEAKKFNLKFLEDEVALGINQVPCVSGMILTQAQKNAGKSFGVSLSHPVNCSQIEKNTFELLIYRSKVMPVYLKDALDDMTD